MTAIAYKEIACSNANLQKMEGGQFLKKLWCCVMEYKIKFGFISCVDER